MPKYCLIFFILFPLILLRCKSKKEKIELKQSKEKTIESLTAYSNTKLTCEMFFKITLSINKITAKYQNINNEDQETINTMLEKREKEINDVYRKYEVTENEFSQFGETHYRKLESYLRKHPEIDEKLRNTD